MRRVRKPGRGKPDKIENNLGLHEADTPRLKRLFTWRIGKRWPFEDDWLSAAQKNSAQVFI
jgi:hypothetical protein